MARPDIYQPGYDIGGAVPVSGLGVDVRATFITKVYGLLFATMVVAAGASVFAFTPVLAPVTTGLMAHPIIAIVIYFGWAFGMNLIARIPYVGALGLLGFGAFTGLWIAPMLFAVAQTNPAAITSALTATAGIFGVMSAMAAFTKKDLSGLGSFLLPGLIVVILASVVNMFLGSSLAGMAISAVTVLLFAGYIAYDTQNIMRRYPTDAAVPAAMALYLNVFILFINLLRLFSSRD